jgi:hypothetical protein
LRLCATTIRRIRRVVSTPESSARLSTEHRSR